MGGLRDALAIAAFTSCLYRRGVCPQEGNGSILCEQRSCGTLGHPSSHHAPGSSVAGAEAQQAWMRRHTRTISPGGGGRLGVFSMEPTVSLA